MKNKIKGLVGVLCLGALIACAVNGIGDPKAAEPVAVYLDGAVSKSEFETFLSLQQFFFPNYSKSLSDLKFIEQMLTLKISYKIMAERGRALNSATYKEASEQQFIRYKESFIKSLGQNTWDQRLSNLKLQEVDIQNNTEEHFFVDAYLYSKLLESELREEYTKNLQNQEYDFISAGHILISLSPNEGIVRSKEDALQRANEISAKLNNGEDFAALARDYSDEPISKDNGGKIVHTPINTLVSELKKAVVDLSLNQISKPILSELGYHIIRIDAKSTSTFDEVKDEMSIPFLQKASQDFMSQELPGLIISTNLK